MSELCTFLPLMRTGLFAVHTVSSVNVIQGCIQRSNTVEDLEVTSECDHGGLMELVYISSEDSDSCTFSIKAGSLLKPSKPVIQITHCSLRELMEPIYHH